MSSLPLQIEEYLHARGGALCGRSDAPEAIAVRSRGPIYLAVLRFVGACKHHLVVKPMSADAQLSDPVKLMQVQQSLHALRGLDGRRLVRVLDAEPERGWIVMPHVAGRTLEAVLRDMLQGGSPDARALAERAIGGVARQSAALHQVSAAALGIAPATQHNKQYLPAMERVWHHRLMRGALPRGMTCAQMFVRVCGRDFARRSAGRLVPVDVQPKNQMVGAAGRTTLIDPDYVSGHPAITLATFLVGLDRLALRYPGSRSRRRIERLKRVFLRAYAQAGEAWVLADLPAFYVWALVRVYEAHAQARPWARPYLAWVYGGALRRFAHPMARRGRAWTLPATAAAKRCAQAA